MKIGRILPKENRGLACNADDIIKLNNEKEYTLICSSLVERVSTDPDLGAKSAHLWHLLYNQSKFENLEVRISCQALADIMYKSVRTIHRYINCLVENGYLIVKNNYVKNRGQDTNTFLIRFPKKYVLEAQSQKDRQKPKKEKTVDIVDINKAKNIQNSSTENRRLIKQKFQANINKTNNNLSITKPDLKGYDKTDLRNNINIINITTNTNLVEEQETEIRDNVVDFDKKENLELLDKQIQKQKDKIAVLELKYKKASEEKNGITDKIKLWNAHEYFMEVGSAYAQANNRLEVLMNERQSLEKKLEKQNLLELNAAYFVQKEGNRAVTKEIFSRLIYSLESLGYSGKNLAVLANEIIFSVRFGELMVSTINKKPLTINHAISIAIKLIREKRWSTPKALEKNINHYLTNKAA